MRMQVAIALPAIGGIVGIGLLLFMGVLGYGIYMGLDVDCGCFSSGGYKKA